MEEILFCIVGPSGSGKTTLIEDLEKKYSWLKQVRSYTTRQKRNKKENNHIFITKDQFKDLKDLVAYTCFDGEEYGITKESLETANLYAIDIPGLKYLKENYNDKKIVTVGLCCNRQERRKRMLKRGQDKSKVNKRLKTDTKAFKDYLMYCNIILNANKNKQKVLEEFERKASYFDRRFNHGY